MRQIVALKLEDEDRFLADHPHWTVERRVQDDHGIAWLSFRVDGEAERKLMKEASELRRASRAIWRDHELLGKPLYPGPQEPLSQQRTTRYRPSPCETGPITVTAPALQQVPPVKIFRDLL